MPPELRRQVLDALDHADTILPTGEFGDSAVPADSQAPEGAIGSMQHLISKQLAGLSGTKIRGLYVKDIDPANPERFIKSKGGDKKIVPIMQEPKVVACDLMTAEGRQEYEKVMELLATSLGTYQLFEPERPPHIEISRDGTVHAIVILKYCRMTKVVAFKQQSYAEVSEDQMKEKFFPNHQTVRYVDEDGQEIEPPPLEEPPEEPAG